MFFFVNTNSAEACEIHSFIWNTILDDSKRDLYKAISSWNKIKTLYLFLQWLQLDSISDLEALKSILALNFPTE